MSNEREPDHDAIAIGKRIGAIMAKRGVDKKAVAEFMGRTEGAIAKMLAGEGTVHFAKLARLAR